MHWLAYKQYRGEFNFRTLYVRFCYVIFDHFLFIYYIYLSVPIVILTFLGDQELHMMDASSSKRLCKKKIKFFIKTFYLAFITQSINKNGFFAILSTKHRHRLAKTVRLRNIKFPFLSCHLSHRNTIRRQFSLVVYKTKCGHRSYNVRIQKKNF